MPLVAAARLPEPVLVDKMIAEANKKLIGPKFKLEQKNVITAIESLDGEELESFRTEIMTKGSASLRGYELSSDLVSFKSEKKTILETKYLPGVIEPSYGIGRILYSVLEHSFSQRDGDENRCCMKFKPCVSPIKVGVFRLINNTQFDPIVADIQNKFTQVALSNKVDSTSGTIGRRYARADELGIPFGVTVDFQTLIDDAVTLRERDSMSQIRVPISRLVGIIQVLVSETLSWNEISSKYPVVTIKDDDDEGAPTMMETSTSCKTSITRQYTPRGSFSRPATF